MKFFPNGDYVSLLCAINGVVPLKLQDQPDGQQARNWVPLDHDRLVGQWLGAGNNRLSIYNRVTDELADVVPQPRCYANPSTGGYSVIQAGGGVWAIQSSMNGVEASTGLYRPNGYLDDCDEFGNIYTHEDFGQGMAGAVYIPGMLDAYATIPGAWKLQSAQGSILWMDVNRGWHVYNGPDLPAGLFGLPVIVNGVRYLVEGNNGVGPFPWAGNVPLGAVFAGFYFNQDVCELPNGTLGVIASAGAGEQNGQQRLFQIDVSDWTATINSAPVAPTWVGDVRQPPSQPSEPLLPVDVSEIHAPFQLGSYNVVYGGYGSPDPYQNAPDDIVQLFDHVEVNSVAEQNNALYETNATIFTAGTIVNVGAPRRDAIRIGGEGADPSMLNQRIAGARQLGHDLNCNLVICIDSEDPLPWISQLTAADWRYDICAWLAFANQGESRADFHQRQRSIILGLQQLGVKYMRPSPQFFDRG